MFQVFLREPARDVEVLRDRSPHFGGRSCSFGDAGKALMWLYFQSGGSAVQEIIDKTNRVEAMKNDVQKQLDETNNRIKGEEDQIASINQQAQKVQQDAAKLTGDVKSRHIFYYVQRPLRPQFASL